MGRPFYFPHPWAFTFPSVEPILSSMITGRMIRAARALLDITQADLAGLSGCTPATLNAIEADHDAKASTLNNIHKALADEGAVFGSDGSVRIAPKAQIVRFSRGTPDATKLGALQILNANQKAHGLPPFVMGEDEDE
jgi:transcriptional regulator with XRE-family HTH domain